MQSLAVLRFRAASLVLVLAPFPALAVPDARAAQPPSVHATRVVAFDTRGGLGGGVFDPSRALGAPQGGGLAAGSTDVHSLGVGGWLVLGFDVVIVDGPGADLLVAENAFAAGAVGRVFGECAFVEVSSDGVVFARFPARYLGPPIEPGPFGAVDHGWFDGLCGVTPVLAGSAPGIDAQDVVMAGGDAFDLADLRLHPDVVAGRVDLQRIAFVRLVDVRSGLDVDATGTPIRDAGAGSADIDAVTVIHHAGNRSARGPVLELRVPADGAFELRIADPDGLLDLDWSRLGCSVFAQPIDAVALLGATAITALGPDDVTFRLPFALPPELRYRLSFALRDAAGARSGVARTRPR